MTLPCCGAYGRESNSSTRFCAGCVLKLAVTRADSSNSDEYHTYDDERDDYPVKKFYKESEQTDNRRFIQCPRCRDVLLVRIKGVKSSNDDEASDSDSSPCDCSTCKAERLNKSPKTAKAISVHAPTFMAKCLYFGRKKGGAELLWKVSLLHHNFLSYKVLGGDEEALIHKLVGCGIIERIPGGMNKNVYRIDKKNQASLIRFFHLIEPTEEESVSQFKMTLDLAMSLVFATWGHLKDEYRIDRSLRCINRVCFLALHKFGFLPPLPLDWWQELVVNLLVAYSAILASQFLCILVAYALVFASVGLSVCYVLKRSNNIKSIWWQTIIASYFVFTVCTYFWWSPFPSWRLFPNATTAVKKLVSWVFNNVVIAPQKALGYVWSIKAMDVAWFLPWFLLLAGAAILTSGFSWR